MDQNAARDDATSAQPPGNGGSSQASGWNQPEQAAQDPAQAGLTAGDAGQEAVAEYAAWSADAGYQQQAPAQQTFSAPQPQSATYTDPSLTAAPADQQAYAQQQQQAYDQQAYQQQYAQQPYDQQAYAQQQQQAYDQQAYQQQYAQQPYDQQAYQQQPQAYDQQQYAQQPYDQQAYAQQQYAQQQYAQQQYAQQQYAQQPYDQQAYQQQQYAQQGYQQPPGQPYAYAQPGQWPGQEQYWEQGETGYGRAFIAVLAGFVLLTWGVLFGVVGALVLYLGKLAELTQDLTLSADVQKLVTDFDEQSTAIGGILLILGLMQVIGAVGIWAHRRWGRAFGMVLGLLGAIWGVGILIAAVGFEALDVGFDVAVKGEESSTAGGLLVLGTYLLVLVAMIVGRRHFRKRGVA